jgi:hypothetical protein
LNVGQALFLAQLSERHGDVDNDLSPAAVLTDFVED